MRPSLRGALAALTLFGAGCHWYYDKVPSPDQLWYLIPWFDHMIRSPAFHPYERSDIPRRSVPGTVPITGAEGDWSEAWTRRGEYSIADGLVNPTDPAAVLALGDTAYRTFCAPCHGVTGAGDGLVGRRMAAPSLLSDRARALSDGHIYSVIRYGRGVMWRYGDKIHDPERRWAVVHYVRRLQAGAAGGGR